MDGGSKGATTPHATMATATAAAEQSQSGAKRRIALAAFALLALAAAAAAIIGTHGSSWGKVRVRVRVRLAAVCRDGSLAAHSYERVSRHVCSTHGCLEGPWPIYMTPGFGGRRGRRVPSPSPSVDSERLLSHGPTHPPDPTHNPPSTDGHRGTGRLPRAAFRFVRGQVHP